MLNIIRDEWKEYLFQDGIEYTTEGIARVLANMFQYLESKKMRLDITMVTDPAQFAEMYQLSSEQIEQYINYFENQHYDNESARKIVKCMNVVYHTLDITIDEALDFAEYVSTNGLTLTKGMNDKFGVDLNEINLFMIEVMEKNVAFCVKQVVKYGSAIIEDIKKLL